MGNVSVLLITAILLWLWWAVLYICWHQFCQKKIWICHKWVSVWRLDAKWERQYLESYTQNHTNMSHSIAALSQHLQEVKYIYFTCVLLYWIQKYAYVLTVTSITMEHKKMKSCLPVHNAALVQKVNSQNNLSHRIVPYTLGIAEAWTTGNEQYLLLSTPSRSRVIPAKSATVISKSYKYPNSFHSSFYT
jgi:hypothetical protein